MPHSPVLPQDTRPAHTRQPSPQGGIRSPEPPPGLPHTSGAAGWVPSPKLGQSASLAPPERGGPPRMSWGLSSSHHSGQPATQTEPAYREGGRDRCSGRGRENETPVQTAASQRRGCLPASRGLEDPGTPVTVGSASSPSLLTPLSLNLTETSFLSPAKAENPENTGQDPPCLPGTTPSLPKLRLVVRGQASMGGWGEESQEGEGQPGWAPREPESERDCGLGQTGVVSEEGIAQTEPW